MTQSGVAYELPMQVLHTNASEYSSLPTPTTQDSSGLCRDHGGDLLHEVICGCPRSERKEALLRTPIAGEAEGGAVSPEVAKAKNQTLRLSGQMIDLVAPNQLPKLPTPTTRDYKDGSEPHERDGKVQTDTVARAVFNSGEVLLGTPRANAAESSSKQVALGAPKSRIEDQVKLFPTLRASDSYERRNQKTMERIARDGGDMTMTTLARTTTDWGKFEPAIRRWEAILDRPAPEPTKPDGKDNNHRLSSKFTEWMMGLPDGWITGHNLKRNDELKLAGNGVVPQQAELALRLLLELPEGEQ
jgi:hypothetical protein